MSDVLKHGDLVQEGYLDPAKKDAQEFIELLIDMEEAVKRVAKAAGSTLKVVDPKTLEALKEEQKAIGEVKNAYSGLIDLQKDRVKHQKEVEKSQLQEIKIERESEKLAQERIKTEQQSQRLDREKIKTSQAITKAAEKERKEAEKQNSAYQQLNKLFIEAAKRAKDLAAAYGINNKEAQKAAKYAKDLNTQLKNIDESVGQHGRKVGDYANAIKEASRGLGGFSGVISRAINLLEEQVTVLKANNAAITASAVATDGAAAATGRWTKAVNILKFAFKSLGIGLIVGLLGSIAASFKTTEKGIVQFEAILNSAGSALKVFIGRLGQFGSGLLAFFPALFKDISNGITNAKNKLAEFFGAAEQAELPTNNTTEAIKQMSTAFNGLGDAIRDTIDLEFQLAQLRRDNRRANLADIAVIRELGSEVERLNQIASDQTLSFEERNKASEESLKLQEKLAAAEIRIARRAVGEAKKELDVRKLQGEDFLEAQEKLSEALNKLDDAQSKATLAKLRIEETQRQTLIKDLTNRISLIEETAAKEKDIRNKEIADIERSLEERRALINEFENDSRKRYENEIKLLNEFDDKLKESSGKEKILIDANELIAISDEELLEQRIKSFALSDKEEDLLRRIIATRKADANAIDAQTDALNKQFEADKRRVAQLGQDLFDEQTRGQLDALNAQLSDEQSKLDQNFSRQKELFEQSKKLRADQLKSDAEFKKKQVREDKTKSEAAKAAEILVIDEKLKNDLAQNDLNHLNNIKSINLKRVDEELKTANMVKEAWFDALDERAEYEKQINDQRLSDLDKQIDQQFELAVRGEKNTLDFLSKERAKALEEKARLEKQEAKRKQAEQLAELFLSFYKIYAEQEAKEGGTGFGAAAKATAQTLIAQGLAKAFVGAFAEGIENLPGKGTGTSDSNVALLSKGESVITAKGTEDTSGLATAVNKEKRLGALKWFTKQDDLMRMIVPKINVKAISEKSPKQQVNDALVSMLTKKLDSLEQTIKHKKEVEFLTNEVADLVIREKEKGFTKERHIRHYPINRNNLKRRGL